MTDISDIAAPAGAGRRTPAPTRREGAEPAAPVGGRREVRSVANRLRARPVATGCLAVLLLILAGATIGGRLWTYHYSDITSELSSPPSWAHPMGTDGVGHDMLARVLRGTQRSLAVGLVVAVLSTAIGAALGAVAGYYGGIVDAALMRFTDVVLSVPGIALVAVLAGAVRGAGGKWVAIALAMTALSWTAIARVVRGMILALRETQFVEAARAMGAGSGRILLRHLLPHAAGPIIVKATFTLGGAVLAESGLSYLGLGIGPPDTSLGLLVAAGEPAATTRPWLFYFPGLVIALIVLSANLVGDALRDALDPATDVARGDGRRRRRTTTARARRQQGVYGKSTAAS